MIEQVRTSVPAAAFVLLLLSNISCEGGNSYGQPPTNIKEHLDKLVKSYPHFIASHDNEILILKDGTTFHISDHKTDKTFEELLEKPDIDDMFYVRYPSGTTPQQPAKNYDPGRVRFRPLFEAMYGDCKRGAVVKNLSTIDWLPKHGGGKLSITTSNGVNRALEAVSKELDELPDDLMKYLKPTSGTYACRNIAGSEVRSMHAYAAAIDVNTKYSAYWRWASKSESHPQWQNRIPMEIVRAFEKQGFIWGGYWYHFDTMHFEYRPELLPTEERKE